MTNKKKQLIIKLNKKNISLLYYTFIVTYIIHHILFLYLMQQTKQITITYIFIYTQTNNPKKDYKNPKKNE